jgi:hypothetical protein
MPIEKQLDPEYEKNVSEAEKWASRREQEQWRQEVGPKKFEFLKKRLMDPDIYVSRSATAHIHNMMTNAGLAKKLKEHPGMIETMIEAEKIIREKDPRTTLPNTLARLGVEEYIMQQIGWLTVKEDSGMFARMDHKPRRRHPHLASDPESSIGKKPLYPSSYPKGAPEIPADFDWSIKDDMTQDAKKKLVVDH